MERQNNQAFKGIPESKKHPSPDFGQIKLNMGNCYLFPPKVPTISEWNLVWMYDWMQEFFFFCEISLNDMSWTWLVLYIDTQMIPYTMNTNP